MGKLRETCGRCSASTVVDAVSDDDGGGGEGDGHDPFAGERIEVPEVTMRRVMFPAVWLGRVKRRLDGAATRLVYGDSP